MDNNFEDRRRFARYPIYCPTQYKSEDAWPRDSSITLNMSEGGALISTRRDMAVNTNVILRFLLKGREFLIRSRVVHVQYGLPDGLYNIGVEFLERPLEFIMNFYQELEAIMFYQRKCNEETGEEISLPEASMRWYSESSIW